MENVGSSSGQQSVLSTDAVVSGTVVGREAYDERKRICRFVNSTFVDIFSGFLDNRPRGSNPDILEGRGMQPAHLDAWIATAMTCLEQRTKLGVNKQTVYTDKFYKS